MKAKIAYLYYEGNFNPEVTPEFYWECPEFLRSDGIIIKIVFFEVDDERNP